jgi:hypothetical protein
VLRFGTRRTFWVFLFNFLNFFLNFLFAKPVHQLPLAKDLAPDLDQLDDLLQYIGHTSPECIGSSGTALNTAQVSGKVHPKLFNPVLIHTSITDIEC